MALLSTRQDYFSDLYEDDLITLTDNGTTLVNDNHGVGEAQDVIAPYNNQVNIQVAEQEEQNQVPIAQAHVAAADQIQLGRPPPARYQNLPPARHQDIPPGHNNDRSSSSENEDNP